MDEATKARDLRNEISSMLAGETVGFLFAVRNYILGLKKVG